MSHVLTIVATSGNRKTKIETLNAESPQILRRKRDPQTKMVFMIRQLAEMQDITDYFRKPQVQSALFQRLCKGSMHYKGLIVHSGETLV